MRLGINLRSDLAKLGDAELAAEFNRLSDYRKTRFGSAPDVGNLSRLFRFGYVLGWPFGRGPIRHRIAYKIQICYFWPFRGPVGTQYLVECEIKDLHDEIKRRAELRRTGPWAVSDEQNSKLR
jgi:hypothetical protein